MSSSKQRELLDPRNRVTDTDLDSVLVGKTLWLLQPTLAMDDLKSRYAAFKTKFVQGILYKNTVLALGYDRTDAYLYRAGTPVGLRQQAKDYRTRRKAEIKNEMRRLQNELGDLF